jgi:hypothetical protein
VFFFDSSDTPSLIARFNSARGSPWIGYDIMNIRFRKRLPGVRDSSGRFMPVFVVIPYNSRRNEQ